MKGLVDHYASHIIKPANGIVIEPLNAPGDSWWAGVDRKTFQTRLEHEQARLRASRFGRGGTHDKGWWD